MEYEVEFYAGNQEYDYEIDASSGKILSFDYDIDRYAADTVQQSNTDIGTEKAKSIALSHAGVKAADTLFLSAEQDYDDGMRVYDVGVLCRKQGIRLQGRRSQRQGSQFRL